MIKKFLAMGVTTSLLLFIFVSGNAMAAPIEITLGWHNLIAGDFFIIANESDQGFSSGDQIMGKEFNRSALAPRGEINISDLNLGIANLGVWSVDTSESFDKWIERKADRALKKAAKASAKDTIGKRRWRRVYRNWQNQSLWDLYQNDPWVNAAFDQVVEGSRIRGRIGNQRFVAVLDIFRNETITDDPGPNSATPVPEPATMLLLGVGLLGTSVVGRKLKK